MLLNTTSDNPRIIIIKKTIIRESELREKQQKYQKKKKTITISLISCVEKP